MPPTWDRRLLRSHKLDARNRYSDPVFSKDFPLPAYSLPSCPMKELRGSPVTLENTQAINKSSWFGSLYSRQHQLISITEFRVKGAER
jgi:hypothetical protein